MIVGLISYILFPLLTIQMILGTYDTLWHHEILERLPSRITARGELALHSLRETLYGLLFFALAWAAWGGLWAYGLLALLLLEAAITLWDFVVEDQTRRLPKSERVLHGVMAIVFGMSLAVLLPVLFTWSQAPTAVVAIDYGAWSWALSAFGALVLLWALRDFIAVLKLTVLRVPAWQRRPIRAGEKIAPQRILVTGATGLIGQALCRRLIAAGDQVIVLTRDKNKAYYLFGKHVEITDNLDHLPVATRIDAVVNLAGESLIAWLWTKRHKTRCLESRLTVTRAVLRLLARLEHKPEVLVQASAIGYYGLTDDTPLDETAPRQDRFSSALCWRIEALATEAAAYGTRVVNLRIGIVLDPAGGAFKALLKPARLGLAAVIGDGRQWVSWISQRDLQGLIALALGDRQLRGAVNATAPTPVTQRDFTKALSQAVRRPQWLRLPGWCLRLALGELSQLFVDGQRVLPRRALEAGFVFQDATLAQALPTLVQRPRRKESGALAIYYNDSCPVCRTEIEHYGKVDRREAGLLTLTPLSANPAALRAFGLSRADIARRLYVQEPDGELRSGIDAFIAIWSRIPSTLHLARILSWPPFYGLAAVLYEGCAVPFLARWNRKRQRQAIAEETLRK